MKYSLILILLLLSAKALSSTCILKDEKTARLSEKYRDKVHFDFIRSGSELDVQISFPDQIENEKFRSATLYKGNIEKLDFDFIMRLKPTKGDNGLEVWYMVEESLLQENYIELAYSPFCGPVILYPVSHNNKRNGNVEIGVH